MPPLGESINLSIFGCLICLRLRNVIFDFRNLRNLVEFLQWKSRRGGGGASAAALGRAEKIVCRQIKLHRQARIFGLTEDQLQHWNSLKERLISILGSAPPCPGDGNGDGKVNHKDIQDWSKIEAEWGQSSHYDFNFDGLTNLEDYDIINDHLHTTCPTGN